MAALIDLTGRRFGRLTVIGRSHYRGNLLLWLCRCNCGTEKAILGQSLRRGESLSCGCLQREQFGARAAKRATHGESSPHIRTLEYRSWMSMLSRCNNPQATGYHNYGGRGVTVCDRWLNSYGNFLDDMGRRPSRQHTLDRYPNNDGNYEPGNVRWATVAPQNANQRPRKRIDQFTDAELLAELARRGYHPQAKDQP